MRSLLALMIILTATSPAAACIKSNDAMDNDRFNKADLNHDGKLSFDEALKFRQMELANAKENAPSAVSQYIGKNFFGRTYPDNYKLNAEQFKNGWEDGDKDKDGFWSREEFTSQVLTKRCDV